MRRNSEPINIVDVGARGGLNIKLNSSNFPITIFLFEPDKEECKKLQMQTKDYAGVVSRIFPTGLGSREESRPLFIANDPACSSIYEPIDELSQKYTELSCIKSVGQEIVHLTTLDIWSKEIGIEYIDYLKLDTQGSEMDILRGGIEILDQTSLVEIEVEFSEIYHGQPLFADIDIFMRSKGFFLWRLNNLVHYSKEEPAVECQIDRFYNSVKYSHVEPGGRLYWGHAYYLNPKYFSHNENRFARLAEITKFLGMPDLKKSI